MHVLLSMEHQDKLQCYRQKAQVFEKHEIVMANWLLQGWVGRRSIFQVSLKCLAEKEKIQSYLPCK